MEDDIKLVNAFGNRASIVSEIMKTEEVFKNRLDRHGSSEVSTLIIYNGKVAGFVNLVREKRNYEMFFLDMVILEEYRHKKIGKKVFELLQSYNFKDPIIAETKIDNIGANKTAKEACIQIATIDDRNIYLVQKERIKEFIDKGYMEKLAKHFEKDTDKKMIRII